MSSVKAKRAAAAVAAPKDSAVVKQNRVIYVCPVPGCTHRLKFTNDHPPLKNKYVSDEEPWPTAFRNQAFSMREHMKEFHPEFKEDDYPKGFRPLQQTQQQRKPPPKEIEVIDLLSDDED